MTGFDFTKLDDFTFFAENRLHAHADYVTYQSEADLQKGVSNFQFSLNGLWKFNYSVNPSTSISRFHELDFDCSDWDDIRVPGSIQLQGYDQPQYVNIQYPWDGREAVAAGHSSRYILVHLSIPLQLKIQFPNDCQ